MRRTTPFEELETLAERMGMGRGLAPDLSMHAVDVDVRDDDDAFVVTADLPGYEREDLDVAVDGRTLTISAERTGTGEAEGADYVRRERHRESVSRTVRLPAEVEPNAAEATYSNGVLTVTLPRVDAGDDTHRIDVE